MEWILSILSTIGIFVLALLILVFFHELGHFLAAKLFKMRVERFSLGFPPRIAGVKIGETDYCISATPLGGYVKISGMIDESMDTEYLEQEPQPWEFRSKPVWQRIIVISAGVIFNMILAVIIFAGIAFTYGEQIVPPQSVKGIYVQPHSVAAQVGFKSGDHLVAVNGQHVSDFSEFFTMNRLMSDNLVYTVERNGEKVKIPVNDKYLDKINKEGFISLQDALPNKISGVVSGSPADKAGLKDGDEIVSINGNTVHYWMQLVNQIEESDGELSLTVNRDGTQKELTLTPNPKTGKIGVYPVNPVDYFDIQYRTHGLFTSVGEGVVKTKDTLTGIIQGFSKMFSGSISVRENLGGPVAIASITKQVTDRAGILGFWQITALLSVTLAIMNILPIPVLDGGHLMFLIYEGITRKEPSARVRMILQQIGFILLIGLFIFVTFNDILRQFGN